MRTRHKKKKRIGLTIFLCLLVLVILAALALGGYLRYKDYKKSAAQPPATVYEAAIAMLKPSVAKTDLGEMIYSNLEPLRKYETGELIEQSYSEAAMSFELTYPDPDKIFEGLEDEFNTLLAQKVGTATRSSDVYDENLNYKTEILDQIFETSLIQRLANSEYYTQSASLDLKFQFKGSAWELENSEELRSLVLSSFYDYDEYIHSLRTQAEESAVFIPMHYKIEENALTGHEPDRSRFGTTDDPTVIEELLSTATARNLIGDETVTWNANITFLPGSVIHYYLDETILSLAWQEETSLAVGTYTETFIADGSQLRRRIAGDQFEDFNFETTSAFAEKTNAILALGGDFYHHGRACGIVVYNRDIYRFEPNTCDTCFITSSGDMLLTYREQFSTIEEAQAFVDENDVLFSLCFGPVIIDNGVDMTPDYYQWGEINELYARSILGMYNVGHYLTLNVNCQMPDNYYLVTLRQAADAVIAKGCYKAYALDGGQTATTVFNNQLINPVQFGWEKPISDIIYFASAYNG